jgi:hypothetical protein
MGPATAGVSDAPLIVHQIEAIWMGGVGAVGLIVQTVDEHRKGREVQLGVAASRDRQSLLDREGLLNDRVVSADAPRARPIQGVRLTDINDDELDLLSVLLL